MPCTEVVKDSERGRHTDFVDKLICAGIAKNHDCDGSVSLDATAQSRMSYLKILKV
jgi:hypothetical protein